MEINSKVLAENIIYSFKESESTKNLYVAIRMEELLHIVYNKDRILFNKIVSMVESLCNIYVNDDKVGDFTVEEYINIYIRNILLNSDTIKNYVNSILYYSEGISENV